MLENPSVWSYNPKHEKTHYKCSTTLPQLDYLPQEKFFFLPLNMSVCVCVCVCVVENLPEGDRLIAWQ